MVLRGEKKKKSWITAFDPFVVVWLVAADVILKALGVREKQIFFNNWIPLLHDHIFNFLHLHLGLFIIMYLLIVWLNNI